MLSTRPSTLRDATLLALAAAAVATGSAFAGAPKDSAPTDKKPVEVSFKASLKYVDGSKNTTPSWSNIRVTIMRDGQEVITDLPLPADANVSYHATPKLTAADLDDDGEPEVLIDIFSSDAEPKRRTVMLRKDGASYAATVHNWGTGGYRLDDVTGGKSPEFLASDSRIPSLYASEVRGPLRIQRFTGGKLRDVSRKAESSLLRDAKRHRRELARARRTGADPRPDLAAYVVDLVRAGRTSKALVEIRASGRRKELKTTAKLFARKLDRAMVRWGYSKRKVLAGNL